MEEKIYKPEELYFSVVNANPFNPIEYVVFITPIEYYSEFKALSDNFGAHNIVEGSLTKAGLSEGELQESIFEVIDPSLSEEELYKNLINAGFVFNKDFDEFSKDIPD